LALDLNKPVALKIDGRKVTAEQSSKALEGGDRTKIITRQKYGDSFLYFPQNTITAQDFPLDLKQPVSLRIEGKRILIEQQPLSSQITPTGPIAPGNPARHVYCHVCGMKNPMNRPFCRDCKANLIQNYDLSPTYYQSSEALASFHNLLDMSALSTLTKLFLDNLGTKWVEAQLLGNAVRLGERQYPELYHIVEEAAMLLAVPRMPRVYVEQNMAVLPGSSVPTISLGSNDDPVVVINSYIAGRATPEEFRFLIAREMGHIKCGHPLYLTLGEILKSGVSAAVGFGALGPLLDKVPGGVLGSMLVDMPLRAAMNAWIRSANFTADRAALVATRNIDLAKQVFAKNTVSWVLKNLSSTVNIDELLSQLDDLDESVGKYSEYAPGELNIGPIGVPSQYNPGYAYGFTVKRLKALLEYYEAAEYKIASKKVDAFLRGEVLPLEDTAKTLYCGYCGEAIPETSSHCVKCGKPILGLV